jgi:hypothetical protein
MTLEIRHNSVVVISDAALLLITLSEFTLQALYNFFAGVTLLHKWKFLNNFRQ